MRTNPVVMAAPPSGDAADFLKAVEDLAVQQFGFRQQVHQFGDYSGALDYR